MIKSANVLKASADDKTGMQQRVGMQAGFHPTEEQLSMGVADFTPVLRDSA